MTWPKWVIDFVHLTPWTRGAAAAFGGVLFAIGYVFPALHLSAWIAVVPLLLSIEGVRGRAAYFYGLTFGVVAFALGANWIYNFLQLFKEYGAVRASVFSAMFWVYHAQVPALVALSYTLVRRRTSLPDLLTFPICLTAVFSLVPMLFTMQLAVSQAPFLTAIQGLAITGPWGLDAVMGLSAILAVSAMSGALSRRGATVAIGIISVWFVYGIGAKAYWSRIQDTGAPVAVGLLQTNLEPVAGRAKVTPGFVRAFPPEMEMTERLVAAGAELVIWPEARYKGYLDNPRTADAFRRQVDGLNTHLLFQDIGNASIDGRLLYNKAIVINPEGEAIGEHAKVKLIPFGEALPFGRESPAVSALLKRFFQGLYREIVPGEGPTLVEIEGERGRFQVAPLICFESVFPIFGAMAVPNEPTRMILVGIVNDGWFGPTAAPYQHRASSALRAVENRTPLIIAMNNGPSAIFMPNGEMRFSAQLDEAGGYRVDVPVHDQAGTSFFSRHPHVFVSAVRIGFVAMLILAFAPQRLRTRIMPMPVANAR